jgi:hypothetical protein
VKWQIGRNVNNDEAESLRTAFAAGAAFAHKRLRSAIEADMAAAFAEWLPSALEARATLLDSYGESLPEGVTTEAFAEASNLRREAADIRAARS